MTNGVGVIGLSSGISAPTVLSAVPSSGAADSKAPTTGTFKNPRVIEDPTAGFITQYLSANGGQIVSQYPSVITVAYLRQGLAADGTVKPSSSSASVTA